MLTTQISSASAQNETPTAPAVQELAPKAAQQTFETMMGALEDNNRLAFVALADADFKAALTPPVFKSVVDQIAFRLQAGHKTTYFGETKKKGFAVYLWRVRFDDDGDDALVEMSIKDEKVGGFFLR